MTNLNPAHWNNLDEKCKINLDDETSAKQGRIKPWGTSRAQLNFTAKTASANQETALQKTKGLL